MTECNSFEKEMISSSMSFLISEDYCNFDSEKLIIAGRSMPELITEDSEEESTLEEQEIENISIVKRGWHPRRDGPRQKTKANSNSEKEIITVRSMPALITEDCEEESTLEEEQEIENISIVKRGWPPRRNGPCEKPEDNLDSEKEIITSRSTPVFITEEAENGLVLKENCPVSWETPRMTSSIFETVTDNSIQCEQESEVDGDFEYDIQNSVPGSLVFHYKNWARSTLSLLNDIQAKKRKRKGTCLVRNRTRKCRKHVHFYKPEE